MGSNSDPAPELIAAVVAGEAEALDRWYRGEHPRVWKLCLGFLADAAEADDAAQDAMLHLADRLERFDSTLPGASYGSWRDTVVLNQCRDRVRGAGRRRRAEDGAAALPRRLPDPAGDAASAEFQALLTAALGRLPEREREAFVLCELEGHRSRRAAEIMDIGESSVRSLRTLARRRLRDLLAPRLGLAGREGGAR